MIHIYNFHTHQWPTKISYVYNFGLIPKPGSQNNDKLIENGTNMLSQMSWKRVSTHGTNF